MRYSIDDEYLDHQEGLGFDKFEDEEFDNLLELFDEHELDMLDSILFGSQESEAEVERRKTCYKSFTVSDFRFAVSGLSRSQRKLIGTIANNLFYGLGGVPSIGRIKEVQIIGHASGTRNLTKHATKRALSVFEELSKSLRALGATVDDIAKIQFGSPVTKLVENQGKSRSEDRKVVICVVQARTPKPTPEPDPQKPKLLNKEAIQAFVWAILGKKPSDYAWKKKLEIAKMAASFLKTAFTSITNTTGPIGPGFFLTVYRQFDIEEQEKPYFFRGLAMGMAYAIMDFATAKTRSTGTLKEPKGIPVGFRKGFYSGYQKMHNRLRMIKAHEIPAFTLLTRELRFVDNKGTSMKHIYNALYRVFKLQEGLHKYPKANLAFTFCRFKYPAIKACCGPNPRCRLDL